MQAYLASTSFVDSQIARVLEKLRELHLEENEHGLWANKHNLAKQPAQAERMNRMRQRLAAHWKSVVKSSGLR